MARPHVRPRFASDAAFSEKVPRWKGPVERPTVERKRPRILTWPCPSCLGRWVMNGAWKTGRCDWCGTPRPTRYAPIAGA